MIKKNKLELTWIGKNNPEYDIANIEPRIQEKRLGRSVVTKKNYLKNPEDKKKLKK